MASKPKYAPRLVARNVEPVIRGDSQKMPTITVSDPREAAEAADQLIGDRTNEHFVSMFLNARNKVIGYDLLTSGSVDSVSVNSSGVVRSAMLAGARAIVTAHQHPSGRPYPSSEDEELWDRLRAVSEVAGIVVLDNLVLGDGRYYAESERSSSPLKKNPASHKYPPIPKAPVMQTNPKGPITLEELVEDLEAINNELDPGMGPYKAHVFAWDDEWAVFTGPDFKPLVHRNKHGGQFAILSLPGHDQPFDAEEEALDAFHQMGLPVPNPSRFDHHDYAGGPVHTRYVGDVKMTLWLGEGDEYQGTAETLEGYVWPWYLDVPTSTKRAGYDPHEYEFVNRVVASVFDLTEDDRIEQAVAWARNSDGTYDIRDEPPASWVEKNPGGLDEWAERRYRGDQEKIERWRDQRKHGHRDELSPAMQKWYDKRYKNREEDLPPALRAWLERKRRGKPMPGRRSNPPALHSELERAARQTARTGRMPTDPRVTDWILEYPHTWDRMVKRFQ